MTDWQAEKGKSKFIIRKEWDFFLNFRRIEINNNVLITIIRDKTEWSTIQGVIGRNFELDYRLIVQHEVLLLINWVNNKVTKTLKLRI